MLFENSRNFTGKNVFCFIISCIYFLKNHFSSIIAILNVYKISSLEPVVSFEKDANIKLNTKEKYFN